MPRRLLSMLIVGLLATACGNAVPTASPAVTVPPTAAPTPTAAATLGATAAPTVQPTGPFAGLPYALDLPDGWTTFDLKDPAGVAALDAFVSANPEMAAAIAAFKALPNVTMAVNVLLGNVVVALSQPTGGLSLDTIAAAFTAEFASVPGIDAAPVPQSMTLPVGPAVHWSLAIKANEPGGSGTSTVTESIYLVASDTIAVLVEFVDSTGAGIPQEAQIIQTLRFTP